MGILEPLFKWGAILGSFILGVWWVAKAKIREGENKQRLKAQEIGDAAQKRQRKKFSKGLGRDLSDDARRLREHRERERTP